jgi:hypothetical protein
MKEKNAAAQKERTLNCAMNDRSILQFNVYGLIGELHQKSTSKQSKKGEKSSRQPE